MLAAMWLLHYQLSRISLDRISVYVIFGKENGATFLPSLSVGKNIFEGCMETDSLVCSYITNRKDKDLQGEPCKNAENNSVKKTVLFLNTTYSEFTFCLLLSIFRASKPTRRFLWVERDKCKWQRWSSGNFSKWLKRGNKLKSILGKISDQKRYRD